MLPRQAEHHITSTLCVGRCQPSAVAAIAELKMSCSKQETVILKYANITSLQSNRWKGSPSIEQSVVSLSKAVCSRAGMLATGTSAYIFLVINQSSFSSNHYPDALQIKVTGVELTIAGMALMLTQQKPCQQSPFLLRQSAMISALTESQRPLQG